MATQAEIADLKKQWQADPCWDIEDTEGFEEHREELRVFRAEQQATRERAERARLEQKAAALGAPGKIALVEYIERLELRVKALERGDHAY